MDLLYASVARESSVLVLMEWTYYMQVLPGKVVFRESSVLVLVEWTYYMQVLPGKVVFWYLWNGPIICKCC